MHAILLTVLALAGGDGAYPLNNTATNDPNVAPAGYHGGGCDECNGGGHHGKYKQPHWMMPQTCYNPKFGCYGADRHMNRYPALHGTYYRRPYNYRTVFDYPWHAELHEPTSFFSYHVNAPPQQGPAVQPLNPATQYPTPVPYSASASQQNSALTPSLRTLRR
jgi:hypothetical protein